jgi:hypothetical protein
MIQMGCGSKQISLTDFVGGWLSVFSHLQASLHASKQKALANAKAYLLCREDRIIL